MALGFTACSGNTLANGDKGTDMKGGFVASTNGYVYFINGVESYTTTYKTGKVTKGALMRVKKDKLTAGDAAYETVVSKLIVSDDKTAGFYINGEYVYYAVPSTENNKKGETKNDQLLFFRTKLDASETSAKIADKDFSHDAKFRFIASGDSVYLAVYSTNLYVYDAISGKEPKAPLTPTRVTMRREARLRKLCSTKITPPPAFITLTTPSTSNVGRTTKTPPQKVITIFTK